MPATLINSAGIILGALIGLLFKKHIDERIRSTIFTAAGLSTVVIATLMVAKTPRILALSLALVLGGLVGAALRIEDRIHGLGKLLHQQFGSKNTTDQHSFAEGFLEASILFCVGAMAIIGSLAAGTTGDYSVILTKTVMDSFVAIIFAAAKGPGVAFSALSILVYQGSITLLASLVSPYCTPLVLDSISGTGGAMIFMIAFNLLGITKIATGNFLPALILAVAFALLDPFLPGFIKA